ncbi:MAG: hypothetical protein H9535_18405 [Ignavibacteria bacterium]|nr:hypothetical protein [Ignavibacteria bacterium]
MTTSSYQALFSRIAKYALVCLFFLRVMPLSAQWGGYYEINKCKDEKCTSALAAFRSASVIVTGKLETDQMILGFVSSGGSFPGWISILKTEPEYKPKYEDGLKFTDAVSWLKQRISKDAKDRLLAIDNAFREVYGIESTPEQQATWDVEVKAQKAWYAIIVSSEIAKLSKDNTLRTATINRVYNDAFGRNASSDEIKYWLPRSEHYRTQLQANRTWLYSSSGAKDFAETVARALKNVNGSEPSPADVKNAMVSYTSNKLIYKEMVAKLQSAKKK